MSTNNFPTNRELIQQSVFVRWCNKHLLKVNKQITNLERDFSDGIKLNDLLQILSEKQVKPYYKWPFFRLMKEENVQQAISFMRSEGIDVDGVGRLTSFLILTVGLHPRPYYDCRGSGLTFRGEHAFSQT